MKFFSDIGIASVRILFSSSTTYAETYYFHNDHLGTPQALTDKEQYVVWQAEYDPFDKATETVSQVEQDLRFPRQYLERDTFWQHMLIDRAALTGMLQPRMRGKEFMLMIKPDGSFR